MNTTSRFSLLLATILFLTHSVLGQKVLSTNATAPLSDEDRRISAEITKLQRRTAQTLAEAEAATQTNISFLTSRDGSWMTMEMMMQQRAMVVKSLIRVIEDTNSWTATNIDHFWRVTDSAATVLGNYRAVEAIPCLVSNIQQDTIFRWPFTPEETYSKPFGAALANIGEPAVPALLDRITQEESDRVADRCLEVIVRIVGKERAAGLLRARMEALKYPEVDEKFKRLLAKTQA